MTSQSELLAPSLTQNAPSPWPQLEGEEGWCLSPLGHILATGVIFLASTLPDYNPELCPVGKPWQGSKPASKLPFPAVNF